MLAIYWLRQWVGLTEQLLNVHSFVNPNKKLMFDRLRNFYFYFSAIFSTASFEGGIWFVLVNEREPYLFGVS